MTVSVSDEVESYLDGLLSGQTPGTRFPSERILAEQLGVARNTVRIHIQHLISAGRLTRRLGAGLFVAEPKITVYARDRKNRFFSENKSHPFEFLTLPTRNIRASHDSARLMQIKASERITEFRRLFTHDGDPMAIESLMIAQSASQQLNSIALFDVLDSDPECSSSTISCELATGGYSRYLKIAVGQPVLIVDRIHMLEPVNKTAHIRTRYRADRFRLITESH
ncbi:GntR family transcriptional regulator [Amycolatopsis lurida]|uniref:GntR family transcriptional regulator n=1 Tax=Amycolatopsis lurida TaxID=31959 RepID=UPI0013012C88|nr:GntR family transcriptional regulator [Amycolatopsis lurida]